MSTTPDKLPMPGPRRFQWQRSGWFGSVLGGSAWLVPTAAILAINGQPDLAWVPVGCFLLVNFVGCVLWHRRDRVKPFTALLGILTLFSITTPLAWTAVSANATPTSLAALHWPTQGMVAVVVTLICPVIIAWFCVLENSYAGRSPSWTQTN